MPVSSSAATSAPCCPICSPTPADCMLTHRTPSSVLYFPAGRSQRRPRQRREACEMATTTTIQLFVFMLAGFVGVQTINRIPPLLHTPLMAATNAISGISLVASLVLAGSSEGVVATVLGATAVGCAMANIVGGFLITDRMLSMFKRTRVAAVNKSEEGVPSALRP